MNNVKSETLRSYDRSDWGASATPEQVSLVDEIYIACEQHYSQGGDVVVECFTPTEILEKFKSVEEVREFCNLSQEQRLNARWGEDSDIELKQEKWT